MKVAVSKRKRHPLLGDDSNTTEAAWSGVQSLDGIVESSDLTAAPQSSSSAVPAIAGATAMASTMETTTCTVVPPEPMPSSSDGSKNKNKNENKKKKRNIVNDPNRFICQMPGCAYRWVMSRPLAAKSFLQHNPTSSLPSSTPHRLTQDRLEQPLQASYERDPQRKYQVVHVRSGGLYIQGESCRHTSTAYAEHTQRWRCLAPVHRAGLHLQVSWENVGCFSFVRHYCLLTAFPPT